ncbi:unannotated protein [freshwater metagenome]|uniref:Unannotated protein n=1 Tax=freshwater metagenome TaxID=449393 RepID=A0A6J7I2Z0_9ZZZZ|nr:alpha/beta fold hydrolase [Actinomycetota bacterium]
MPHADLGGRRLHYLRRGAGDPLLLIMGLGGTHLSWGEPFLQALAQEFEVITFDHRGLGWSDNVDGPVEIADLADDAGLLLEALGIPQAHVLGISMGGMVAQELVLRRPSTVRTLTLGCTYAGGSDGALTDRAVIDALLASMRSGDPELALRTRWDVNVSPEFAQTPGAYEAFRDSALALPAPPDIVMAQMRATARHDASARLPTIAAPTLVFHGDVDRMLSVSNAVAIAAAIPSARLEIFAGTGHLFWVERPAESAALICEHCRADQ